MDSHRWQQISQLYHAALARQGDDRAAFLAETCRDDEPIAARGRNAARAGGIGTGVSRRSRPSAGRADG